MSNVSGDLEGKTSRTLQIFVLAAGVLAISSGSVFIRMAQEEAVPSLVIATWRTAVATLVLLPFAVARRRAELARLQHWQWGLALLSGVMLGLHFATWINSLALTSITSSTVLVATTPLWVGLAAPLVLSEPLSPPLRRGILLAMLGSVVIGVADGVEFLNGRIAFNLAASTATASQPLLGNVLALLGGLAAAAYLLIGRRLRQGLSLLSYTTVVYGMAALTLLIFTLIRGQSLLGYTPTAYVFLLAVALVPQLIGHSSFNWALSFLPAAFVSVAAISEPVGATLLGIIFFQEWPGPVVVIGSMLILAGVLLASRKPKPA